MVLAKSRSPAANGVKRTAEGPMLRTNKRTAEGPVLDMRGALKRMNEQKDRRLKARYTIGEVIRSLMSILIFFPCRKQLMTFAALGLNSNPPT